MTTAYAYERPDADWDEILNPSDPDEDLAEEVVEGTPKPPDDQFVQEVKETAKAARYRKKTTRGLNFLFKNMAGNPGLSADAAAIVEYGPGVAKAVGNLADKDARVARAIDFITEDGIDNPYVLTVAALLPLAFQVIRNHEPAIEKFSGLKLRVPFTKRELRIPIKISFKFKVVNSNSYPPSYMMEHVFRNPAIAEALDRQGIHVAWPSEQSQNGRVRG